MSNKLENLYNQVFEEIYPQIKYLERGVLYKTIQIILYEENVNTQDKTLEICNYLDIKPSNYLDQDFQIIYGLMDNSYSIPKKLFQNILSMFNNEIEKKMEQLKFIVAAACVLVGVGACIYFFNDNKAKKPKTPSSPQKPDSYYQPNAPRSAPSRPVPADLCLVVLAKEVGNLTRGYQLNRDDLLHLINLGSHFLCVTENKATANEDKLTITNDNITPDSNQEVYIRIRIDDAENLINEEIPYYLKSNLSTNAIGTIINLKCLGNLSGLETFNRI